MIKIFLILFCVFLLYILALRCKQNGRKMDLFCNYAYTHRGLHGKGVPENSMKAFQLSKDAGYGVEFDVHLMADGNLAVIHDSSLKRTTGADVYIEDLCAEELDQYFLEGTRETLPLFNDVLDLFDGKVPIVIELKSVGNNYKKLCESACSALAFYTGLYCLESFDPRCVYWLKKNRPDLIRGQLSQNYFISGSTKLPGVLKFLLTNLLFNFLCVPNFIGYRFSDRKNLCNIICLKLWKVNGFAWPITSKEDYNTAVKEGWLPIFEGFDP